MKKYRLIIFSLIIFITLLGTFLFLKEPAINMLKSNATSTIKIEIPEDSWEFTPEEIVLKKDKKYTFIFDNKDKYPHGFTVEELKISEYIKPATLTTFEFTPKISGEFTSYCSVTCGQGHFKMKGKIIVRD